jgi:hypothetical protein
MRKFNVSDIDWDLESIQSDDYSNLPSEIELNIDDCYLSDCDDKDVVYDAIIDKLSDHYGVCCNSCVIEEL